MHTLIQRFKSAFYDPAFYYEARNHELHHPLKLLCATVLISIVLAGLVLTALMWPRIVRFTERDYVGEFYPDELVITFHNGEASTNVVEPYYIPFPASLSQKSQGSDAFTNLVVIDTKNELTLTDLESYDATAVVTRSHLVLRSSNNETRIVSFEKFGSMTVSKETVGTYFNTFRTWIPAIVIVGGIIVVLFLAFVTIIQFLFTGLFVGLIALVITRARSVSVSYSQAYVLGLYSLVPLAALNSLLLGVGGVPFIMDLILATLILVANIKKTQGVGGVLPGEAQEERSVSPSE